MDINGERLLKKLKELGNIGRDKNNKLTRLAASKEDKEGRDLVVKWMKDLNLDVKIDKIGNIFGLWIDESNKDKNPILTGSHIDTVINAGIYDGCYGVIGALEVIETLKENNYIPNRPIGIGVFTNEEGVRFQPDMMGSLVYAEGLDLEEALNSKSSERATLKEELKNIEYYGEYEPGFIKPEGFIELHIEQGPILDKEGYSIGAVENLQGISWQKITIDGVANHAGTTPMYLRKDAGYCAAKIQVFLNEKTTKEKTSVSTIGTIEYLPNAINVIPSKAVFTVDLRDPNSNKLKALEEDLDNFINKLESEVGVKISKERLARFEPVLFDEKIVSLVESSAKNRDINYKKITSGAGQDAQMMARICPTAMIFIPSKDGISHNPKEFSKEIDLINGANILLDVIKDMSSN